MAKQEKVERVAELKGRIEASDALLLTDYRGLAVADITALRRSLSEGGARFSVVKNTLMRLAASDGALAGLHRFLEGPTAVAFIAGDPVAAAKKVVDAQKKFPSLVLKGGYMEGRVLSAEEARALADLESRESMLSSVAGMVKHEMVRAASTFQALQSRFVGLLEAFREKVPGETTAEDVPEPPAEPAPVARGDEPSPEARAETVTPAGHDGEEKEEDGEQKEAAEAPDASGEEQKE